MITRGLVVLSAFALLVTLGGCGDSRESVTEDGLDSMEELADILEGITDEASAKDAASEIEDWAEDMKDLIARAKEFGEPSADEKKALEAKYGAREKEIQQKFSAAMSKIMTNPQLATHLAEAMQKIQSTMSDMK